MEEKQQRAKRGPVSPERREELKAQLARGRATAAANRAAKEGGAPVAQAAPVAAPVAAIRRNDPDPRPVEGTTNRVAVEGMDPDKHYVWVSTVNDPTMNPGSYKSNGYHFSQYDPAEEKPTLGYQENLKQGDRIEAFGMVLMECSKEHKAQLDTAGQQWADRVSDNIRRRDIIDETEPLTAAQRASMRGITTGRRYGGDDRDKWSF